PLAPARGGTGAPRRRRPASLRGRGGGAPGPRARGGRPAPGSARPGERATGPELSHGSERSLGPSDPRDRTPHPARPRGGGERLPPPRSPGGSDLRPGGRASRRGARGLLRALVPGALRLLGGLRAARAQGLGDFRGEVYGRGGAPPPLRTVRRESDPLPHAGPRVRRRRPERSAPPSPPGSGRRRSRHGLSPG